MSEFLYGAVEAGGTKINCAIATGAGDLHHVVRIPTTTPEETLGRVAAYFADVRQSGAALRAVGVASFGPVALDRGADNWGHVTATPKPGWQHADMAGPIGAAARAPVAFDTDVNGAALGEARWGAGQGCDPLVYVTVGTGIGGGAVVNGRPVHGLMHPEMGHMLVRRDADADPFPGRCPYHGDCLEGLACGPALTDRWGETAHNLPQDHPAWQLQADYLGQFCANLMLTLSPQRIIVGGGVMAGQPHLYARIADRTAVHLATYIQAAATAERLARVIVAPGLADRSGLVGALALAQDLVPPTDD